MHDSELLTSNFGHFRKKAREPGDLMDDKGAAKLWSGLRDRRERFFAMEKMVRKTGEKFTIFNLR